LAVQIANPADLLGPRTMEPAASSERRDEIWNKYVKGESTIAKKDPDEKVQVKGAQ
jgi:pilus assembly protein CpaD